MQPDSSPAAGRGPFFPDVARTALGVFIGGLAALFAHDAIVGQRPPAPPATPSVLTPPRPVVNESSSSTSTQAPLPPVVAQPAPPPAPPAPEPAPPPPAPPQAEAPQPVQDPGQKKADEDLKTAQALATRLEAERQQRRADAWARYFQPSPVCRADPATGPCADAHLAARKRFDAQYVDR
ncbi:MAG: hypothetical protein V4679_07940 [Pseudomonadota bacterium]